MTHALRTRSLPFVLVAATLAACSGSSSDDATTVSLAVTDAASDDLSTFNIGVETVELVGATGNVSLLQIPTAVDFAALTDLSRVLNITAVPEGTYTGLEVTLLFDNDRVVINGSNTSATLLDSDGVTLLTGTKTLPIDFTVPLQVTSGNYVVELDLDLNQSADVDVGMNQVALEPTILPRVNRADPKEHAVGGDLRTVVLGKSLFRIGLEAPLGGSQPVVEVAIGPGTVFQIDGVCEPGIQGLATLATLTTGSWVQAFGSVDASSQRFQALTVEAGHGSYNGGTDIVEGVITGRTGGAGTDATLTVRGHGSDSTHTAFEFNLDYTINTSFANTKVVRRGSATQFTADDLNVGQKVRMFGLLNSVTDTLDVSTVTDVVRMEPTWIFGTANEVPGTATAGQLEIDIMRVDLRDASMFNWNESGTNPPTPTAFTVADPGNLSTGQMITAATPIVALGFFAPVDAAGADYMASVLANREKLPSLLLIRERPNPGFTVSTATSSTSIDYTFSGTPGTFEKAVVDMGFAGQTDLTVPGNVSLVEKPFTLGLGIYLLRDRTLNTLSLYFTFTSFYQAVDAKLLGGATLFNVGALGIYVPANDEFESQLAGVTVQ